MLFCTFIMDIANVLRWFIVICILGIVGNPRVGGDTELLVAETLKVAGREGAQTELLRLADKEVEPCDACLSCRKTEECRIKDDFNPIFAKMVEADGIILGIPVYFGSATLQVKARIDRAGYLSWAKDRVFENKVCGALVVARRARQNFRSPLCTFKERYENSYNPC